MNVYKTRGENITIYLVKDDSRHSIRVCGDAIFLPWRFGEDGPSYSYGANETRDRFFKLSPRKLRILSNESYEVTVSEYVNIIYITCVVLL